MRLIGIPVRSFSGAKVRLAPVLDEIERASLARRLAAHTVEVASACGEVAVVTAELEVADWAESAGVGVIRDPGRGLDAAAEAVVAVANGRPWAVLHADLPLLHVGELVSALGAADRSGACLAPSLDGGTSLVAAEGTFDFAYGPGSFHRHQRARPDAAVAIAPGLAVDVDRPADLSVLG